MSPPVSRLNITTRNTIETRHVVELSCANQEVTLDSLNDLIDHAHNTYGKRASLVLLASWDFDVVHDRLSRYTLGHLPGVASPFQYRGIEVQKDGSLARGDVRVKVVLRERVDEY